MHYGYKAEDQLPVPTSLPGRSVQRIMKYVGRNFFPKWQIRWEYP